MNIAKTNIVDKIKPIVLIGRKGQLGQELLPILENLGKQEVISFGKSTFDLCQTDRIIKKLNEAKPSLIINAAAYTAVDKAESEPELAHKVNAVAPSIIAQEADKLGAFFLHYSTDYVFDGKQSYPYQETDKTNPQSVYGESKLKGEAAIQANCNNYLIIRTAWVYGSYGQSNFVKTMLRLGKERKEIRVVADQIGSPTWAKNLAQVTGQIIPKKETIQPGIYHYTNSGVASWYDFAVVIFAEAKQLGFPLQVERVIPITTAEYPTPAKRPAYSVLSSRKISQDLNFMPPYWQDSLIIMLKKQLNQI